MRRQPNRRPKYSFRLDPEQGVYLRTEADSEGITVSRLLRQLLDHAIRLRRAAKARGR